MEVNESSTSFRSRGHEHVQGTCKSFGEKCSHVAKKQRAKFYILRRCIAMLCNMFLLNEVLKFHLKKEKILVIIRLQVYLYGGNTVNTRVSRQPES
ncbi:hypothetical protein RJ639_047322 [Escallonia herrerae]|uniref:Uncharacterized protein n=1 Tax=Escallonia herrerae TaxID=1293975 RepID=A0AA88WA01_9ASTE|nr:hypothetical protein RJ639_047322 [Escallonia herrerae]